MIAQTIQLALAPVFVLVAIGNILNLLSGRLGRVVDRSRQLQDRFTRTEGPDREELVRRMRKRALKENRFDEAKEDVIRQRFVTYEEETKPILDFYPDELICQLDGAQPPVNVFYDMLSRILTLPVYQERARIVA